jgi:hypothetical protein
MILKILPCFASVVLALAACASLMAADAAPPAKGGAKGKDDKKGAADKPGPQQQAEQKTEDATQGIGAIGKVLPLGQINKDAAMPSFRDGKLSSFVHADTMVRVDDDNLDMTKVNIILYGVTQADDLRVQLISGFYNMTSQVLESHERSRISRSDFQLEGDRMVFDTRSQQGKMIGNVHMIIFDAESMRKKPLVSAPAQDDATPDPQPNPKAKPKAKK